MGKTLLITKRMFRFLTRVALLPAALVVVLAGAGLTNLYAQNITITSLTGGLATSPLIAGTTDQAILGIQIDKANGGTNAINGLKILLTQDPSVSFQNVRLIRSDDDNAFGTPDLANTVGTVTLSTGPNAITISGTITPFSVSGTPQSSSQTRYFFIVVDVKASVTSATPSVKPTLASADVTVANNTVSGSVNGTNYAFAAPTLTIGSLNATINNLAASPLIAGSTGEGIFGFSLSSNSTQTITALAIQLTSTPTGKLGNFSLVESGDTDFATTGDNTILGSLTFTPSATQLAITGLNEVISTQKNYFLVADVDPAVTSATANVKPSLGSGNITMATGSASGSATGTDYSFDAIKNIVTQITGGIAASPLGSATTNQAILGFSISSNINADFTTLNVDVSSTPTGKLTNIRLFLSADNTFGSDASIGATVNTTATQLQFSGFTQSLSTTAKYYFIVADIVATVNASTPQLKPSFTETDVTLSTSSVSTVTVTGTNYSFVDATPPTPTFTTVGTSPNVSVSGNITITYDEAIRNTDGSAITNANVASLITLKETNSGGAVVAFTATINSPTNTIITINPTPTLKGSQLYYVSVAKVEDVLGNETSAAATTTFTTEAGPAITSFTPGSTCEGEIITVTGTGFGSTNKPDVTINGTLIPAANVNNTFTNTQVKFTIPTGATTGKIKVTNNDNTLTSANSAATLTVYGAINQGIAVVPTSTGPALNGNTDITISNTQDNNYKYSLIVTSAPATYTPTPPATVDGPSNGTGGDLILNTGTLNKTGAYNYKISVTRTGCTTKNLTNTVNVSVASLIVNSGSPKTICKGENITLGGNPTATGGTGFYQMIWSTVPASGFSSNVTNPTVNPTVTTTYRVSVKDSPAGTPVTSDVLITVNQPESAANLAIQLSPAKTNNTYSSDDSPVQLNYTLNGSPGVFSGNTKFTGPGVNSQGFVKYFYPNAADIGSDTILLKYENNLGCITEKTIVARIVTPNGVIGGIDAFYCDVNQSDALVINQPSSIPNGTTIIYGYRYIYKNQIKLYYDGDQSIVAPGPAGSAYTASGINLTINPGKLTALKGTGNYYFNPIYDIEYLLYNPADVSNPIVYDVYVNYPNFKVSFPVQEKPTLHLFVNDQYCENDNPTILDAAPQGGTFKVNNTNTGLTFVAGQTFLNPGNAALPDNIRITYEYTNTSGCFNKDTVNAVIYRLPNLDFTLNNGCEGDTIDFTPQLSSTNTIDKYSWNWDDKSSDKDINGASLGPISHSYPLPASYKVSLDYVTNTAKPCSSSISHTLVIGEIPAVNFTWQNVCKDNVTSFAGTASGLGSSTIQSVSWDFENTGYGAPSSLNTTFTYTSIGSRPVKLKVVTNKNCSNITEKSVYTVPTLTTLDIPYTEDFNASNGSWVVGTSNDTPASWAWDTPSGFTLNGDESGGGKAWFTNSNTIANLHYNLNEKSWVHTPCFDLSLISRPVLSLDIRTLSQGGLDGVVIQMDSTSKTNTENTWVTLGSPDETPNWYNQSGLPGNPGSQQLKQYGWSGDLDKTEWRNALIPLDNYLPKNSANRQKIRFRIAFGSQGSNQNKSLDGFSFDNFKINERNRIVLLELFTNSANTSTNALINSFALKPVTFQPKDEIIKLEYHLNTPEIDSLNIANSADQNSRAAYYGITSTPEIRVDADYNTTPINSWVQDVFSQKSLKTAAVSIDTIFIADNVPDKLTVHTKFTALENLAPNTIVQIAIVESNVTYQGDVYHYILRKFLPNAAGTKMADAIISGTTFEVEESWTLEKNSFKNISQLAVIVFLQNELTKEIYQTKLLKQLNYYPNIVTGIEPTLIEQIKLFPNPANESFTLQLPQPVREQTPVKMFNVNGVEVHTTAFEPGQRSKVLPTKDFASGVYLIQLETKSGTVRKKVMVMHE